MTLVPLGDQAWLVRCADERAAIRLANAIHRAAPVWLDDVLPAYATVGVYYDNRRVTCAAVEAWLKAFKPSSGAATPGRSIKIPVCYEHGPDLPFAAELLKRSMEDVIHLHLKTEYTVYAIGFVPGFPYLGYLQKQLSGVPRLATPRTRVEPGSVGITGRQTGIYPLPRPGGWPLIGRTPLTIVDPDDGFFPISVGDRIRFERIDDSEFKKRFGQRLVTSF